MALGLLLLGFSYWLTAITFSMGIHTLTIGGIGLMIVGVAWFLVGIAMGRVFTYPIVLVVVGLIALIIGMRKDSEKKKRMSLNEDSLDSEIT